MNPPFELVDRVAARIRDLVRVHPGPNATRALQADEPIILSGREAETAAYAALDILGPQLQRADEAEKRARAAERETARLRAALSKERAERAANGDGSPLQQLRAAVLAEPGSWTSQRAQAVLERDNYVRGPEARRLLNQLADEGLLISPGPRGRIWTRPGENEDA